MIILTRPGWLGLTKIFTLEQKELLYCGEAGPQCTCRGWVWRPRSVQRVSVLKAHSSQWDCLRTGEQQSSSINLSNANVCSPVTATVFTQNIILMCVFPNLMWGQTRAWCLESAGWGTDGIKGPKWFSFFSFQGLMHSSGPVGRHRQLILVLEGELYLIPFALLKGSSSNEYLYERFSLIAVPSIQSLNPSSKVWHCLIKPLSHGTSLVGCRFLYMLE